MKRWFVMSVMGVSLLILSVSGCATFTGQAEKPEPVKAFTDPITGMEFVRVTGGCFDMGDVLGDRDAILNVRSVLSGASNERPIHNVCVSDFYLGKYEVTQGQWKAVMGSNPSEFKRCGANCPVETVSWEDAQAFILKLNEKTGKGYRLPTEAEWEYAVRSGGKIERYAGSDSPEGVAWYFSNSEGETHPVGQKQPNALGFYDMTGNVWEWCQDWFDEGYYAVSPQDNPQGPSEGDFRVRRGGGWYDAPKDSRNALRGVGYPDYRHKQTGFRLCLPAK